MGGGWSTGPVDGPRTSSACYLTALQRTQQRAHPPRAHSWTSSPPAGHGALSGGDFWGKDQHVGWGRLSQGNVLGTWHKGQQLWRKSPPFRHCTCKNLLYYKAAAMESALTHC